MALLDRIKDLCIEKGVSQRQMEKDINISNGASSKWDTSSPSGVVLDKLSDYFGVTTDYLLGKSEYRTVCEQLESFKYELDSDSGVQYIKDDVVEYLDELHKRPEMKMLFKVAKGATKEDVEKAVKIIEMFKTDKSSDDI